MNDIPTPIIDTPAPSNATIADTIRGLYLNADQDTLSLIAGTVNLYTEAKGRLSGSHRHTAEDARRILDIVMVLLDTPNVAKDFTGAKPPAIIPKERRA